MDSSWKYKVVVLFVMLAPSTYFGLKAMPTEMGLALAAGALALLFFNIDRISSIKGPGFEAKLNDILKEATITLDKLKSVIEPLLIASVKTIASHGKLPHKGLYIEQRKIIEQLQSIEKALPNLKAKAELNESVETFHLRILYALWKSVWWSFENIDIKNTLKNMNGGELWKVNSFFEFPTQAQIEEVLKGHQLTPKEDATLKDYLHYLNNKDFPS